MVSFATPTYKHLTTGDYNHVYEPAEDTFLMIDALEKDINCIKQVQPNVCLEIGPGSGVLITFLSQIVNSSIYYLASDVNKHACEATRKTALENNHHVECVIDRSLRSLKTKLKSSVDIILFNPPYVVTPSIEVGSEGIEASWAGGIDGREVINELLPVIVDIISKDGLFYLLLVQENKPDEIISFMCDHGFEHSVILRRQTGPERLLVIRFNRNEST